MGKTQLQFVVTACSAIPVVSAEIVNSCRWPQEIHGSYPYRCTCMPSNPRDGFVGGPEFALPLPFASRARCSGRKRISLWSRCSKWSISCVMSFGVYRKASLLCACPGRLPKAAAQAGCCGVLEAPSVCGHAVADRQHHPHTVCYMERYWKPARNWYCPDSEADRLSMAVRNQDHETVVSILESGQEPACMGLPQLPQRKGLDEKIES